MRGSTFLNFSLLLVVTIYDQPSLNNEVDIQVIWSIVLAETPYRLRCFVSKNRSAIFTDISACLPAVLAARCDLFWLNEAAFASALLSQPALRMA
jgi:hypothetical protein